jgi:hypothetical protein
MEGNRILGQKCALGKTQSYNERVAMLSDEKTEQVRDCSSAPVQEDSSCYGSVLTRNPRRWSF